MQGRQQSVSRDAPKRKMKVLAGITSYGTKNDVHLERVIREYNSMSFNVDIVVFSNVPKSLGERIEVIVGLPTRDPWSLGFAHKRVFADRRDGYDLFIYSEDDVLITERNIHAFLRAQEVLPANEIVGFFRYEEGPSGAVNFPEVHGHFHWDPGSVRTRGGYTFAYFTNEHSACYIATRDQMRRAVDSGGFSVGPREGKYDLLCTAATDIYTQCGMRKLICVSHVDDFLVHHLPNRYVGTSYGVDEPALRIQLDVLLQIARGTQRPSSLLPDSLGQGHYPKDFYEPADGQIVSLVPAQAQRVLSLGCGWGAMEALLAEKGLHVVAVPLDPVIGACAGARGVETTPADFGQALAYLAGKEFDVVVVSNLLHLIDDPPGLLLRFAPLLSPEGRIIAKTPTGSEVLRLLKNLRSAKRIAAADPRELAGSDAISEKGLRSCFEAAGLRGREFVRILPPWAKALHRGTLGLLDSWLASEIVAVGTRA